MKKCPNCSQMFDDDNDYCPEDGTLLNRDFGVQSFGTFQSFGEVPTQVIPRPHTTNPQFIDQPGSDRNRPNTSQYLIFGVILLLAMAVVGFGVAFFRSSQSKLNDSQVAANGSDEQRRSDEMQRDLEGENERLRMERERLGLETPAVAYLPLSPPGKWNGDWKSPSGAHLIADVVLSLNEAKWVEGEVVWTLRRTVDPSKQSKVGLSATEFVRGTFDPVTRNVSFAGFRKDDPYGVLANLDKYRLALSSDGNQMTGVSSNFARWNGHFNLNRR